MTTEQAEQSAQETAEPLTAQQAQVEIERLQSDADFQQVYLSQFAEPGAHKEAVARMTGLFALAHPPEPPPELARLPEQRPQGEQPQQQPLSEDEQAEAELHEASQVMESRFGDEWQEEMSGVRDSIHEIGGDALFEHLESNYGSDPAVMGQLMEMQRENERYPLVAALAELVDANMTPNRALLEIERRLADPDFVIRYTDEGARGHKESLATMRALFIAADPPAFMTSGVQE